MFFKNENIYVTAVRSPSRGLFMNFANLAVTCVKSIWPSSTAHLNYLHNFERTLFHWSPGM